MNDLRRPGDWGQVFPQPFDYGQGLVVAFWLDAFPCQPVTEGPRVIAVVHEARPGKITNAGVEGVAGLFDLFELVRLRITAPDEQLGTPAVRRPASLAGAVRQHRLRDPHGATVLYVPHW